MFETIKKLLESSLNSKETQSHAMNCAQHAEFPPSEWAERDINKWLKKLISDNRQSKNVFAITRYISIELEDNNIVKIIVMSQYYFQVRIETQLIDIWHDHRTSSLMFKINEITMSKVPLLPRIISEKISYILLSVFGIIFNPLRLNDKSLLRLNGDTVYIEMHDYLVSCGDPVITRYIRDDSGQLRYNYFIIGAETNRGVLKPIMHQLSEQGKARSNRYLAPTNKKSKSNIFDHAAIGELALVAMVVSFCVVLLYPFLKINLHDFSLTSSFISSVIFLLISLLIINMAREVYHVWLRFRTSYRKVEFKAEDNNYKLERLKREIDLEMDQLKDRDQSDLEKALFRASRYRSRAGAINEELERANFERRVKYGLAYVVTVISELAAYRLAPWITSFFN
jgi:hypothetical protein